ncbi:hypothetical protein THAPSDRAFT_268206 [Thalassiosira pseudonana CCMP1335]|uniref:Uncharacterized protein n=1 Tax=Thalassiosira pseudonana TaxID=35128 RepID=B8BTT7_THAPS|nr:hypothetical protein THAPSDRAFT_268206 [Thalassiosira pseudonana CCMP1335]EED95155.1 hypothetical protein THAPSDRAFT_268206 [Thalassiosira pseudonana CCMP1335]
MNPLDLEQSAPLRRRPVRPPNTATDGDNVSSYPMGPPGLPAHHPLNILKRSAIISGTLYALYDINVFHSILHSPDVSHTWFKTGIATSLAIIAIKAYIELYEGKKRNKRVEYDNFKTATHAIILLILASWISFHMALSPVYGGFKSLLIMVGFGYGVLIQGALVVPVWGQNLIAVVAMTFFLQQYK